MRKVFYSLLGASSLLLLLYVAFPGKNNTKQTAFSKIWEDDDFEAEQNGFAEAMKQEFELTRDPNTGTVPSERLLAANAYRQRLLKSANYRTSAAVAGITWQERGPNNIGGRTRTLLFDKNDAANGYKKVWAGAADGGLWYTNDITATPVSWNRVNDLLESLAVTAIVQNPANPQEMYFGTGEGIAGTAPFSSFLKGFGIWKSTDGGATWNRLASTNNIAYVNDLLIDKSGNLFAAVRAGAGTDAFGVVKSDNGGTSWTQVLGDPVQGTSGVGADLELAANGDVYAAVGVSGERGQIFVSPFANANTGNTGTWTDITPNASGTITTANNTAWERIELATAPSDANLVYALFQGSGSNSCTSIQQYNKATNAWTVKTVPMIYDQNVTPSTPFTRDQAWYDLIAAVDPNNANTLYVAGIDACRTTDGGSNWTQITTWALYNATGFTQTVHADQHMIAFAPGSSSRAVWGTDGGVYYTADANSAGKPTFVNQNNGYNVTQFYSCAIHPTAGMNYFLAGSQDNGTQKFNGSGLVSTTEASGGDGGFCHIDQSDPNVQITAYTYNDLYVSTNGGATFNSKSLNKRGSFINPSDYDSRSKIFYSGDDAGNFTRWNDPATGGTSADQVAVAAFSGAKITHVAVSPTVANRVYFGLDNGSVVRVDNANTGTSLTGTVIRTGPGNVSVSCVAIDATNENHLLVTYTNYGTVHIYESANANSATPTWTNVQGNLPDMPVRWVMFDPRNSGWAMIATELGIWSTDRLNGTNTQWAATNNGLANVRVDMLKYRAADRTLVAATHGRGLFTAVIPSTTLPMVVVNFGAQLVNGAVQLNWNTSFEQNAHNFEVQKSVDGVTFSTLGFVAATGNSSTIQSYTYLDKNVSATNYYRLRMNDNDGQNKLSDVVLIKTNAAQQKVWVLSNPFSTSIDVRFELEAKKATMRLLNSSGTEVANKTITNAQGLVRWNVPLNLSKGVYIFEATVENRRFSYKIVKQ